MSVLEGYASVTMIRENLENIPQFSLPSGFSIRWFRKGDVELWLHIQSVADLYNTITPELFVDQFGTDSSGLEKRQCFLVDNQGNAIGTASAWFDNNYNGTRYGRVHWVAIVPDKQGRGLSKPLMTIVCNRLRELGHKRAYLTTSTARFPAISLYDKFGFVPEIKNSQDQAVWNKLEPKLRKGFRHYVEKKL
jgi:GNAT superfamily N-acetyltransferase